MRKLLLGMLLLGACHGPADTDTPPTPDAAVVNLVAHDISPPLREMARHHVSKRDPDELEFEPVRPIPHPRMKPGPHPDRVVQTSFGPAAIPAPTVSFEGMGAGMTGFQPGGVPPDTDGDIGIDHYVQVVNISLTVFKRSGEIAMGPVDTGTVWQGFTGSCAQTNDGDATVRFDHLAKRWVIAQFTIENDFAQCVAVSTTEDPTGPYARYQFGLEALNDYPKMGLWPDAYYFTFNMFGNGGFQGGKVCAMDRTKMLAGAPDATMQCFDAGMNFGGLLAADLDGATPPPAGAPNYLVAVDTETQLAYWQLHVDFATPANSQFMGPTSIPVETFAALCDGGSCVRQPGQGAQLASLGDRAMNRFVYRRFADHESLLVSHSVAAGAGGGIRWYELRTPSAPTVFQQGTFAPDAAFRWIPSMAMDASGNIAALYNVSSTTVSPGIRYTARTPSDPPGTMGMGEGTVVTGAGAQSQIDRWGDYSALNIDPTDGCTFWGTSEYKKETGGRNWRTRVAAFQLPTCGTFSLTANDAETVQQTATAMYPVNTMTISGAQQMVQLSATGLPAGVTAAFDPPTVSAGGMATVTLTADATAPVGPTHYTIVATGNLSSSMVDVSLMVTPAPEKPPGGDDDDDGKASSGCCGAAGSPSASALLGLGVLGVLFRRRRR